MVEKSGGAPSAIEAGVNQGFHLLMVIHNNLLLSAHSPPVMHRFWYNDDITQII